MSRWVNNIVGYDPAVAADQLTAHPENWRCHPKIQHEAMIAALDEFGWMGAVIVNQHTGLVIDGHLRVGEAIAADETVPVLYVDVTEEVERKALASFDTITGLASVDKDALRRLAQSTTFASEVLTAVVTAQYEGITTGGDSETAEDEPTTSPLTWGYVQWGKKRKIDSSEAEVTALDALYELYRQRNDDSDIGFVRWLVDGQPDPDTGEVTP